MPRTKTAPRTYTAPRTETSPRTETAPRSKELVNHWGEVRRGGVFAVAM